MGSSVLLLMIEYMLIFLSASITRAAAAKTRQLYCGASRSLGNSTRQTFFCLSTGDLT